MGRLIEGFWDCHYCDKIGIRGGIRECPNCGKARDENTTFYLNKRNMSYVPKEKTIYINKNPDWVCNYCNQLNSDNFCSCTSCSAPRTDENLNYFENRDKQNKKDEENYSQFDDTTKAFESLSDLSNTFSNISYNEHSLSFRDFFTSHISNILIALFSILAIAGLIFIFIPKPQQLTVQNFSWQRSIEIERYQTVKESDWNLPAGARLLYAQEEFSHYEEVLDHYETKTREVAKERLVGYEEYVSGYRDLGNGYFEEIISSSPVYETYYETETYEEPVYRNEAVFRTKYYYEIDKWLFERSVKTSGKDKEPYWGEVNLASDERVSSERENYYISALNKKGKEKSITLSYEDWNSLEIGENVTLKISFGYGEIVE